MLNIILPNISSAHYIVGIVNDARDGTSANDRSVVLWNPTIGISDNVTDIVGVNGNSGTSNIYMIDCEMLNDSCKPGQDLYISVVDSGDNYIGRNNATVKVTGKGYNEASNITLNSPPNITSILVEDSILSPLNEIDLVTANERLVICEANITEYDGDLVQNISSQFYDNINSFYGDVNDNNTHYTNNSCYINQSYSGATSKQVLCSYNIWYYANSNNWSCVIKLEDNLSVSNNKSDLTFINPLLSIGINDTLYYGFLFSFGVSSEIILNITNYGNVNINLSLSGYGETEGDGYSMNCDIGDIPVLYEKYNLTSSTPGDLTLSQFESSYMNLTSDPKVKKFNLNYRFNEDYNEAYNNTYWRIYVSSGVGGRCIGNILFSASLAPED